MSAIDFFKIGNFILQFRDTQKLELMTNEVNIPGITLGEISIPRNVVRDLRPGDSLTFDDITVSVICDETLQAFKELYTYITKSANPENGELDITYPVFDSTLFLTTNKNNIQHSLTFYNCFFKSISGLQLSSGSSEEEHVTFSITLGYSWYKFE